jgi:hypothetical protein
MELASFSGPWDPLDVLAILIEIVHEKFWLEYLKRIAVVWHVLMDPDTVEHNKPVTAGTLLLRANRFFTCGCQSGNIYFGGRVN